jgi:hypothetical protein
MTLIIILTLFIGALNSIANYYLFIHKTDMLNIIYYIPPIAILAIIFTFLRFFYYGFMLLINS